MSKIILKSCPKHYTKDLDKTIPPKETVTRIKAILDKQGTAILQQSKRIDSGRLGIPVYLSICGPEAKKVMPSRKQMGKGSSPEQAEASALMELVERFSLFSFWNNDKNFMKLTWSAAQEKFGEDLLPLQEILHSVNDNISQAQARKIMDLVEWKFCTALCIPDNADVFLPIDWFKTLNEYNGSSAGNSFEESILQGGCELIERHVSALIDQQHPELPTISFDSCTDPVLQKLINSFVKNGIQLWLKDFSLDFAIPTVGALAYDPSTFPESSEIVFTAGTASSPTKATIRAITELAQLAGDFHTNSSYEPSGLPKYSDLQEIKWIKQGALRQLSSLPTIEHSDILVELQKLSSALREKGFSLYSVNTTHPDLDIASNYNIIPGFLFRERSKFPSVGLFVGRILTEQMAPELEKKLSFLDECYPKNYFTDFFRGLALLQKRNYHAALSYFKKAEPLQPGREEMSLTLFYQAHTKSLMEDWQGTVSLLDKAIACAADNHAFFNLRGVAHFKLGKPEIAAQDFEKALTLDKGSAIDLANLGICYKKMGKIAKARELLQACLELDPNQASARQHLAELVAE